MPTFAADLGARANSRRELSQTRAFYTGKQQQRRRFCSGPGETAREYYFAAALAPAPVLLRNHLAAGAGLIECINGLT